jgi:hypothetical protein
MTSPGLHPGARPVTAHVSSSHGQQVDHAHLYAPGACAHVVRLC